MNEPAIPINIVTIIPPGSRPGTINFASAPTIRPMMSIQRKCIRYLPNCLDAACSQIRKTRIFPMSARWNMHAQPSPFGRGRREGCGEGKIRHMSRRPSPERYRALPSPGGRGQYLSELSVTPDQVIGGAIVSERWIRCALEFRHNSLGKDFTELNAPLIERIDVPDDALSEHQVFIESDQFAQCLRRELLGKDCVRRPVSRKHAMRFRRRLSEGEK